MARLVVGLIARDADPITLAIGTPEQMQWSATKAWTYQAKTDQALVFVPVLEPGESVPTGPVSVSSG